MVDKAISLDPSVYVCYVSKAMILQKLANHQAALEAIDKALSMEPNSKEANVVKVEVSTT